MKWLCSLLALLDYKRRAKRGRHINYTLFTFGYWTLWLTYGLVGVHWFFLFVTVVHTPAYKSLHVTSETVPQNTKGMSSLDININLSRWFGFRIDTCQSIMCQFLSVSVSHLNCCMWPVARMHLLIDAHDFDPPISHASLHRMDTYSSFNHRNAFRRSFLLFLILHIYRCIFESTTSGRDFLA